MITLKETIQDTIGYLKVSEESVWSHLTPNKVIRILQNELQKADNGQALDLETIALLYSPTGAIQEISLRNDWGDEYLAIAQIVDQYTMRKVGNT